MVIYWSGPRNRCAPTDPTMCSIFNTSSSIESLTTRGSSLVIVGSYIYCVIFILMLRSLVYLFVSFCVFIVCQRSRISRKRRSSRLPTSSTRYVHHRAPPAILYNPLFMFAVCVCLCLFHLLTTTDERNAIGRWKKTVSKPRQTKSQVKFCVLLLSLVLSVGFVVVVSAGWPGPHHSFCVITPGRGRLVLPTADLFETGQK